MSRSWFNLEIFCCTRQVVKERKVLEVHINKGMRNGQKIVFSGEADEAPGQVPGDIIFIVEEKVRVPHRLPLQQVMKKYPLLGALSLMRSP